MAAGKHDLLIERGTSTILSFVYKDPNKNPISLAGYTARMQIRDHLEAPDPPLAEYTTGNGKIVLEAGAETGRVDIEDDTTSYTFRKGIYDLELVDAGGKVDRVLQGKVKVDWDVTR